jgi:hypothetical protein
VRAGRGPRAWLAAAAWGLAMGMSGSASADVLPSDARPIVYSYELENLEAFGDKVFVVWPRACGSDGEPLGDIDLALNPQWEPRMHDVDYEVVTSAKRLAVLRYCADTMRLYALPVAEFAKASRPATQDEWTLGVERGGALSHLPALDAIDLKARMAFFEKDRRVARSSRRFDVVMLVRASASSLKAVHDVLRVERVEGTTVSLAPKRAKYTYMDGASEDVPYTSDKRPSPSRPNALARPGDSLFGDTNGDATPAPDATSQVAPDGAPGSLAPAPSATRSRGLLWALAGVALVVVVAVAWRRRAGARGD